MFRSLLSPARYLVEIPMRQVLKYVLKSSVGRYIRHDLKFEQFCLSLSSGSAELCDIELVTEQLHNDLKGLLGEALFQLKRVHVKSIAVHAFGSEADGLLIHLSGLTVEVVPAEPSKAPNESNSSSCEETHYQDRHSERKGSKEENVQSETGVASASSSLDLDASFDEDELSRAAQDGLKTLGEWLENYAAGLQIKLEDITVQLLQDDTPDEEKTRSLNIHLPCVEFSDDRDAVHVSGTGSRSKSVVFNGASVHVNCGQGKVDTLLSVSRKTRATLRMTQDTLTGMDVQIPWVDARLLPRAYSSISGILSGYLPCQEPSTYDASSPPLEHLTKSMSEGDGETAASLLSASITKSVDEENSEAGFYDALSDEMMSASASSFHIAQNSSVDNLDFLDLSLNDDSIDGEHRGIDFDSLNEDQANMPKAEALAFKIQIVQVQVQVLYQDTPPEVDTSTFESWDMHDSAGKFASEWFEDKRRDISSHMGPCEQGYDRLVIRALGTCLRGQIEPSRQSSVGLDLADLRATELLSSSPLQQENVADDLAGIAHVVMSLHSESSSSACQVNFIQQTSLIVNFAPLVVSWDNAMAERLKLYLPESSPDLGPQKGAPLSENFDPLELSTKDRSDSIRALADATQLLQVQIKTTKALLVLRVPKSDTCTEKWRREALVIETRDLKASTVKNDKRLERFRFGSKVHTSAQSARDEFYVATGEDRDVMWRVDAEFALARARNVSSVSLEPGWGLLEDELPWALAVQACEDVASSSVVLPRLSLCVRRPLSSKEEVQSISKAARERSVLARRAFKNRVYQRRAPGNRNENKSDPAGDHDLDKDQEPPVHEVMESTVSHGFATADAAVRLCCPAAKIKLERAQYHDMSTLLQLILGSLPTFTQADEAMERGDDVEGNRDVAEESHGQGTIGESDKVSTGIWDDDICANADFGWADLEARDPADLSERAERAGIFFQLDSGEGFVEFSDGSERAYQLAYTSLQVSLVDSKTMIEALDASLLEALHPNEPQRPVFYSTKWGRNEATSPPVFLTIIDSSNVCTRNTTTVNVSMEGLTLRYEPDSMWWSDLSEFFTSAPEPSLEDSLAPERSGEPSLPSEDLDFTPCDVMYTELTLELFDSMVDYRPYKDKACALVSFGLLRFSSNIASPSVDDQSYHITARDVALYLNNCAPEVDEFDPLCGSFTPARAAANSSFDSVLDFCDKMLYAKIAVLDVLELFVRVREELPSLSLEVSLPNLSVYTCADSLATISEIGLYLGGSEEHDDFKREEESVKSDKSVPLNEAANPINTIHRGGDSEALTSKLGAEEKALVVRDSVAPDDKEDTASTKGTSNDTLSASQHRDKVKSRSTAKLGSGVYLDGFFAIEPMEVPSNISHSSNTGIGATLADDVESSSSVAQGRWYSESIDEVADEAVLESDPEEDPPTMLMWGEPGGNAEEIELEEFNTSAIEMESPSDGVDLLAGPRQVAEDHSLALREQDEAAKEYVAMVRQECPTGPLASSEELEDCPIIMQVAQEACSPPTADGQEFPTSRWYEGADTRIYPHYLGIPYEAGPGSHIPTPEALAARMDSEHEVSLPKGPCATRFVLRDLSLQWFLFDGCDWNSTAKLMKEPSATKGVSRRQPRSHQKQQSPRGSMWAKGRSSPNRTRSSSRSRHKHPLAGRKNDTKIEVLLSHVSLIAESREAPQDAAPLEPYITSSVAVAVRDLSIVDHVAASDINKMLCEWVSEEHHPRVTGSSMLRLAIEHIHRPKRDSYRVRAAILPLKVNLDQDTLDFVQSFLNIPPTEEDVGGENNSQRKQNANIDDNVGMALNESLQDDSSPGPMVPSSSSLGSQESQRAVDDEPDELKFADGFDDLVLVEDLDWRMDTLDIRAFKIKLDYCPKRVSLKRLADGDKMALVNLFAYEGLEVALRRVRLEQIRGWEDFAQQVQASWQCDISHQRHRCLAGVSFPPINTVANIGSGLTNLVLMPLEQYQRDGRIVHGVKRGTVSFVRTIAVETLGAISRAAMTAQSLLEHARDVLTPSPFREPSGRIEGSVSAQLHHRGLSSSPGALLAQPRNVQEGLERGRDSIAREVKRVAYVLVAIPFDELQQGGPTAAIKSVLRGVPIAVIRAGLGMSQALSSGLVGLRNTVDPEIGKEAEQKYKPGRHI